MPTSRRPAASDPGRVATYSISDLAREFALTTRAIRCYEDSGLVTPRRNGRARIYSERERVRIKLILRETAWPCFGGDPRAFGSLRSRAQRARANCKVLDAARREARPAPAAKRR